MSGAVEHYLRFLELVKIWGDVEENAFFSPWESDASEKQDEKHEVWISSWEIDHLRRKKHYNLDVQPVMLSLWFLSSSVETWFSF